MSVDIPTGVPLIYSFDNNFNLINKRYLIDDSDLQKKIELVKKQGKAKYCLLYTSPSPRD